MYFGRLLAYCLLQEPDALSFKAVALHTLIKKKKLKEQEEVQTNR